jgi:hypothetical protein
MAAGNIHRVSIWEKEGEPEPEGLTDFELREFLALEDWDVPDSDHLVLHCRHPKHREWALKAVFEVYRDDVVLSHLTIYPAGDWAPSGGLTDEVRRTVRLDDLRRMAKRRLQLQEVASSIGVDPSAFKKNTARGRKGRSDLDLARIAESYVALTEEVEHPADTLAERMHLNPTTVRGLLWQARKRGLLTRAPAGQSGGRLTGRAKGLLDATG